MVALPIFCVLLHTLRLAVMHYTTVVHHSGAGCRPMHSYPSYAYPCRRALHFTSLRPRPLAALAAVLMAVRSELERREKLGESSMELRGEAGRLLVLQVMGPLAVSWVSSLVGFGIFRNFTVCD